MENMDTKILVAIIAAFTAILSAIISSLVTLYVSRKSLSKESDKNAIRYIERKIELLEKQKNKLSEFMRRAPKEQDKASAFAELILGRFNLANEVLKEIGHYLNDETRQQLSDDYEIVGKSLALEKAKDDGFDVTDDNKLIKGPKIMDRMNDFAENLSLSINKELVSSVNRIEKISGLRK